MNKILQTLNFIIIKYVYKMKQIGKHIEMR